MSGACGGWPPHGPMCAGCIQILPQPRGRAPGEDGLPYECYTVFWEEVGEALVAVFLSSWLHGVRAR
jgi:hypothetical protein